MWRRRWWIHGHTWGGRPCVLPLCTFTGKVRPRYRFDLYGAPLSTAPRHNLHPLPSHRQHRLPTLRRRRERYCHGRQVNTVRAFHPPPPRTTVSRLRRTNLSSPILRRRLPYSLCSPLPAKSVALYTRIIYSYVHVHTCSHIHTHIDSTCTWPVLRRVPKWWRSLWLCAWATERKRESHSIIERFETFSWMLYAYSLHICTHVSWFISVYLKLY